VLKLLHNYTKIANFAKKETMINVQNAFPFRKATGIIYFDNAATTQKPAVVINAIADFYINSNANVHRGNYALSQKASKMYEDAREAVAKFINADQEEIVFTSGATESLNIVAQCFCNSFSKAKSNNADLSIILTTEAEHHSNIVPFQYHCLNHPVDQLKFIPADKKTGEIDIENLISGIKSDGNTIKMITIAQITNTLGTVNDVKRIIAAAHEQDIPVCVDGAQSIAHMPIDVKDLDCDFFVFSGHKMYAPMGIGVLYGKKELLKMMPPFKYGGGMITHVGKAETDFQESPYKFEAGTPNVEGAVGLHAAIDFINEFGMDNIKEYEDHLLSYTIERFKEVPKLKVIGNPKSGIISFVIDGMKNDEVAEKLDMFRIAMRSGTHCAHPIMTKLGFAKEGTVRMSFAAYNTVEEINYVTEVLKKITNNK
jgi:cysteine desulfurase/selenocysteine lyase